MHRIALAVAAAALAAAPGTSQQTATVTEAEFLSVLVADHPALAARREAVAVARSEAQGAGTLSNPQLSAVREDPSGPTEQIDWILSWQLPHPSRGPAVASSEQSLAAAEARFAADRLDVRLEMREAYADWAIATELARSLAGHQETIGALARRERTRARRGEASGLAAARLELAATELRSQLALLESQALQSSAIARGWNPAIGHTDQPALSQPPPVPTQLADEHPRLTALEHEIESAQLARQAQGRYVDLPELLAGWQQQQAGDQSFDGPIVGLSWQVPLADRNRAERARADAREAAAAASLEAEERRIGAERLGALAAYQRLASAAAEARAAGAANDGILTATTAAFQAGEASVTDLLDTVRSVLTAESTALELHAATLAAHRRLERLAGRPLDLE
jgi:outer membrane protein TolC